MGVNPRLVLSTLSLLISSTLTVNAAPALRLVNTTVGPVSIATGQNGAVQTVEAYNGGDGSLNLTATTNATWLVAALGTPATCSTRGGTCIPIRLTPQTSTLAKGSYTATVTVADSNAMDAPQTVTVTVGVGGGVPSPITLYAPPGGQGAQTISSNGKLAFTISTSNGASWLSVPLEAGGSFRFVYNYQVSGNATNLAAGTYNGQFVSSGSSVAEENKTVPVTFQVTTQPIVAASDASWSFRVAQGSFSDAKAVGVTKRLTVKNLGKGTLTISSAAVAGSGDTSWLKATLIPDDPIYQAFYGGQLVDLAAKPGSLAPGHYTAEVRIASNAVNSATLAVPVDMEVVASTTAPALTYNRAVNNATFESGDPVSPGDIVALFGEHHIASDPLGNTSLPLPTDLGGTKVYVNGGLVPLYYASNNQINFQLPYEATAGSNVVEVERQGVRSNKITMQVVDRAPRLLRLGLGEYGIIQNAADYSLVGPSNIPGLAAKPVKAGDAITIYMIGGGQTSPPATTGAAVTGDLRNLPATTVSFGSPFGGVTVSAIYSGLTPNFVGLYQVNAIIPADAPTGMNVPLYVTIGGEVSNRVEIAIQ